MPYRNGGRNHGPSNNGGTTQYSSYSQSPTRARLAPEITHRGSREPVRVSSGPKLLPSGELINSIPWTSDHPWLRENLARLALADADLVNSSQVHPTYFAQGSEPKAIGQEPPTYATGNLENTTEHAFATPNALDIPKSDFVHPAANTTSPNDILRFDGEKLTWESPTGEILQQWDAVSGARGFQSSEHQSVRSKGPIPEGEYSLKQNRYQTIDDLPYWKRPFGATGLFTNWPGLEYVCGNERVWIDPNSETDTLGRGGFSVHGGAVPGSAGCIDLTDQNPQFMEFFRSYGNDITLIVDYGG